MTLQEQITEYIVTGNQNYKGWNCDFVGDGSVRFVKNDQKDIKAHRGREVENWIEECWEECKNKIDEIELG